VSSPLTSSRARLELSAAAVWRALLPLVDSGAPAFAVAWSGGLDSTVLLHTLRELRRTAARPFKLRAIHVNHQLQPAAVSFARHCRKLAKSWAVPITVLAPAVPRTAGASIEELARDARYAALGQALTPGEYLLSAQHADDQMETVLLALLRGAGPKGLAAMPAASRLGAGKLLRPLLAWQRDALLRYARQHDLQWIDDPTNGELSFDRNYLRAEVVPALKRRWPSAAQTLGRSARHAAVAAAAMQSHAAGDLAAAADGADLETAVLHRYSPARLREVLRLWLTSAGWRAPDERRLQQIEVLMAAREDAQPELVLPEGTVRRASGRLVLCLKPPQPEFAPTVAAQRVLRWKWRKGPVNLAAGRQLQICADQHGDLDLARLPREIVVTPCAALTGALGRSVRKTLQELDVPWWQRADLPVLITGKSVSLPGDALALADYWLAPLLQSSVNTRQRGRIFWR
jgi:tRNA(Ile)-lysidine synthase